MHNLHRLAWQIHKSLPVLEHLTLGRAGWRQQHDKSAAFLSNAYISKFWPNLKDYFFVSFFFRCQGWTNEQRCFTFLQTARVFNQLTNNSSIVSAKFRVPNVRCRNVWQPWRYKSQQSSSSVFTMLVIPENVYFMSKYVSPSQWAVRSKLLFQDEALTCIPQREGPHPNVNNEDWP